MSDQSSNVECIRWIIEMSEVQMSEVQMSEVQMSEVHMLSEFKVQMKWS